MIKCCNLQDFFETGPLIGSREDYQALAFLKIHPFIFYFCCNIYVKIRQEYQKNLSRWLAKNPRNAISNKNLPRYTSSFVSRSPDFG
jgi:hypothetical protein